MRARPSTIDLYVPFFDKLVNHCANAVLVDRFDRRGGHFQRDPTVLLRDEKALGLQIRVKFALGFNVRVGYPITVQSRLAC